MKAVFTFIFSFFTLVSFGQIVFFEGTWQQALDEAKKQDKMIFVDCYTTWCGPCKRMTSYTFKDVEAGKYFNEKFINYKIDMEHGEGPAFGSTYPVQAYPTLKFIGPDGKIVLEEKGYREPSQLIELGQFAFKKFDQSPKYEALYNGGDHSPETTYKYIKSLNDADKSSLKIANAYLQKNPKGNSALHYKIIFESAVQSDSKPFDVLISNKKVISNLLGEDVVYERIFNAYKTTASKAITLDSPELFEKTLSDMKSNLKKEDVKWLTAELMFQKAEFKNDKKGQIESALKLVDFANKTNGQNLTNYIQKLSSKSQDKETSDVIEKMLLKKLELYNDPKDRLDYAILIYGKGRKEDAKTEVLKAKEEAKKLGKDTRMYDQVIQKLNIN